MCLERSKEANLRIQQCPVRMHAWVTCFHVHIHMRMYARVTYFQHACMLGLLKVTFIFTCILELLTNNSSVLHTCMLGLLTFTHIYMCMLESLTFMHMYMCMLGLLDVTYIYTCMFELLHIMYYLLSRTYTHAFTVSQDGLFPYCQSQNN